MVPEVLLFAIFSTLKCPVTKAAEGVKDAFTHEQSSIGLSPGQNYTSFSGKHPSQPAIVG